MAHKTGGTGHGDYDLLGKTELTIQPVVLDGANLNDIAARVAKALGMNPGDVWVVDVRGQTLTIDVLADSVDAHGIVGKQDELLRRLDELPGVDICEDTAVSSAGMLGWIATEGKEMREALGRAERMSEEMLERIKKRVIVFSTGWEVASGQIEDTNTQAIAAMLGAEGYTVNGGGVLPDEKSVIAGRMRLAIIDDGFGLVITTGGVGAEDKDHTVEAVLSLDPEAATPYICRHEVGSGRHVKDGVRVAVGQYRDALIVALPGPNDEVVLSLEILAEGLKSGVGKPALAESIARKLRERLRIISGRNASHGH